MFHGSWARISTLLMAGFQCKAVLIQLQVHSKEVSIRWQAPLCHVMHSSHVSLPICLA